MGVALGVVLGMVRHAWRRRRSAARRRVELPNSAYSAPGVRSQEDRDRWGRIETHKLHPLNREEVERLLDVVDREGVRALTAEERHFLDNMTLPRMG
jgi:hypothetical protein